jgi:Fungal Zn(2)-Cys(6) binuclear cluster domain
MDQGGPDPQTPQTQESRPKKTRNRLPVSCEPCRIRRAKCDRERPHCGACSKRGEMEKCVYQVKGAKHGAKSEDGGARIPVAETEDRLRHLESMITQVIQSGRANSMNPGYQQAGPNGYGMQPTPMTTGGDPAEASPDPGQLSAIMADLQELRSIITGDHNVGATDDMYDERTVLLGASTTPSLEFILHQYLPDRQEVESYLAAYFRATFVPIPVIHSGSFQRQLQEFWRTKHHADPIWTGLLFAILAIAAHITSVLTGDSGSSTMPQSGRIHST